MFICCNAPHRRRLWQQLFGTDRLPVRSEKPRWICDLAGERLVYDLDLDRLRPGAVYRLAGYVARRKQRPYALVLSDIQATGFWVDATGCELVEGTVRIRPFPFFVGSRAAFV